MFKVTPVNKISKVQILKSGIFFNERNVCYISNFKLQYPNFIFNWFNLNGAVSSDYKHGTGVYVTELESVRRLMFGSNLDNNNQQLILLVKQMYKGI